MTEETLARRMVSWHGLARPLGEGLGAVPQLLDRLRCIQLDPLEPLGSQADLTALARLDGLARGDVYRGLLPGHAFEHYAKEKCLLPAAAFPYYRERAEVEREWRTSERRARVSDALLDEVEAEVRERGPTTAAALADRGRVTPLDWSGWKGTAKASTMALEILVLACRVVVCGRRGREKVFDVPERALARHHDRAPDGGFDAWALRERVAACGLMPTRAGPQWGLLRDAKKALVPRLLKSGELREITVGGRRWLTTPAFLEAEIDEPDDRMRILGPLDPLIWDRDLVRLLFGFDYVWEVYKPARDRRFGWYVVPLLHRGRLVARLDARFVDGAIRVDRRWDEAGVSPDHRAFEAMLERHAAALRGEVTPGSRTASSG